MRFQDWKWCETNVLVERPWHWFRIVALHRISLFHRDEKLIFEGPQDASAMPLVEEHRKHRRLMPLSLGIMPNEVAIAEPTSIDWSTIDGLDNWVEKTPES